MQHPTCAAEHLPAKWRHEFISADIQQQSIGESRADVFLIRSANRPDRYLKSERIDAFSELPDETERLRWMAAQGLPCPAVLDTAQENDRQWLLMSAMPGQDLASANLAPERVVSILATALQALHRLPIAQCLFDHRLEQRIAAARRTLDAGLVDESDFDDERMGRTAQDAFAELLATQPRAQDLVVAHGDACLPNFMAKDGVFTGYIDCGRLGISDRHQDLALAARSIEHNLGREWIAPFYRAYGMQPDDQRIAFYCLLDEFF
ncbi:APH(3')-II family aminoglycoside O-phosphotransferase [Achromobacter sp.]|uniref:APH(3')-II family aminoglycoside O-phosphotransferase n=1 Tax=Achromobacter sp. TaxID=134375 RepID=UPI0028A76167|nr:APH(3')-II family aminoglycoside O-phosphotransferase [Achromobacter sp.]